MKTPFTILAAAAIGVMATAIPEAQPVYEINVRNFYAAHTPNSISSNAGMNIKTPFPQAIVKTECAYLDDQSPDVPRFEGEECKKGRVQWGLDTDSKQRWVLTITQDGEWIGTKRFPKKSLKYRPSPGDPDSPAMYAYLDVPSNFTVTARHY